MRRDLKLVFKNDIKRISKLRGMAKVDALKDLNEKIDLYMTAEDFVDFYPQIYTKDTLTRIANARNSIEASNIMTTLRRAM